MPTPSAATPPTPPQRLDWRDRAACAGLPPHVVFARRREVAEPALHACGRCLVQRRCAETVAPAESWFDGVSAGVLWSNGRPVALHRRSAGALHRKERP